MGITIPENAISSGAIPGAAGSIVDPIAANNALAQANKSILQSNSPWGNPIPVTSGTRAVPGKIIWSSDMRQVSVDEDASVANAPLQFEIDLAVSFGFAGAPPANRAVTQLVKLWAQETLCFDSDDAIIAETFHGMQVTFHPGLIDAAPDAMILADKGDLAPSWRNQMYCVIHNFPLWLFGLTDSLPDFVGLIYDVSASGVTITPYDMTTTGTGGFPNGMVAFSPLLIDHVQGGRQAFYTTGGVNQALVHTQSPIDGLAEISRGVIPGQGTKYQQLHPDRLCIHDPLMNMVLVSDQVSNSTPIHLINLTTGSIVSSLGQDSINLTTDIGDPNPALAQITSKTSGDMFKTRKHGGIFTGFCLGGFFDSICAVPVNQYYQGGSMTMRFTGTGSNTGGSTGFFGTENIQDVCAYPIIGRKDLEHNIQPASGVWPAAGANGLPMQMQDQDGFTFVARGTKITLLRWTTGFDTQNPVQGPPGIGLIATGTFTLAEQQEEFITIPGAKMDACFVDDNDHNLVVFWRPSDSATDTIYMSKYKVLLTDLFPEQGWRPVAGELIWQRQLDDYFPSQEQRYMNRESVWQGIFGYVASTGGNFIEIDLATGATLFKTSISGRGAGVGYTYNPRRGTVEYINGSTHIVEHIKLRSTIGDKVPLRDVITSWLLSAGYTADQFDVGLDIDDMVWGGAVSESSDLWGTLKNVGTLYRFVFYTSGTKIIFRRTANPASAATFTIPLDNLWASQDDKHESLTTVFAGADELSGNAGVTYIDKDQHYVANTQAFRRTNFPVQVGTLVNDTTIPIPIVMVASEALRRSAVATYSADSQSEVQSFKLPLSYLAIEPGDIVNVFTDRFTYNILVGETILDTDWTFSITGTNLAVRPNSGFTVGPNGEWVGPGFAPFTVDPPTPIEAPSSVSDSGAVAFDVPLLRIADNASNAYVSLYVGAAGKNTAFVGANVSTHVNSDPWVQFFHSNVSVPVGLASAALPATSFPFQTDNDTVLTVTALNFDIARLVSVTDEQFRSGYNAALVGIDGRWELIFFGNVTVIGVNRVELSKLARGRRGTELHCNDHLVSDSIVFVRLNNAAQGLLPLTTAQEDTGGLLHARARGDAFAGTITEKVIGIEGNSLKPWAPVRHTAIYGSEVNAFGTPNYGNTMGGGGFGFETHVNRRLGCTVTGTNISTSPGENDPAALVDGSETSVVHWATGGTLSLLTFDFHPFGYKQRITEFQLVVSFTPAVGNWVTEASNDGLSWITLEAATALLTSSVATHTFTNPDAYWYYRLRQTTGTVDGGPHLREIYFKTMADVQPNDLVIKWIRRDRLGDEFVTIPQPMNELTEEYEIEILRAGVVVRTVTNLTTPQYVYSAVDQATDGFAPPLATLTVRVYQMSALAGRGFTGEATIEVT